MKKNNNLGKSFLATLFVLFFMAKNVVFSAEVTDFSNLNTLINSASTVTADIVNDILDASENIKLTNKNVTINGGGFNYVSSVSNILGFDVQSSSTLTINNLTIKSFEKTDTGWGGAIYNAGTLNLNNVSFYSNSTSTGIVGGGAIMNDTAGIVNITGSTIFDGNNNTKGDGGAIYNRGTITVTSSGNNKTTFNNNTTSRNGGVVYNEGTINFNGNIEFSNNKIVNNGGAIYNTNKGSITFTNDINTEKVVFSKNYTDSAGAGIYNTGTLNMSGAFEFTNNYNDTGDGASIFNSGAVSLNGKFRFEEGSASKGGAISNSNLLIIETSSTDDNLIFYHNKSEHDGGAIYNTGTTIINGKGLFEKNYTYQTYKRGGAIFNSSSLNLSGDFDFKENSSYYGGAIYNSSSGSMLLFGEFLFDRNSANLGAAIYSEGDVNITGTRQNGAESKVNFENNEATTRGGAIYIAGSSDFLVRLDIESVDFKNNKAGTHGGAIHIHDFVNFNIIDSLFENNSAGADGNLAWGGAISVASNYDSVYAYIERSTFKGNFASNSGGAIAAGTSITIVNSKFLGNQAGKSAGAVSYDPRNALGNKSFELIADGGDTVISGNWVGDKGTTRNETNAEGLYFGNAIVGDDGQAITGEDGNDSNIYMNAGNNGTIIINDIVNALGDSYDNKREIVSGDRDDVNNPNIQINKSGVTYHKFAEDVYDENEENENGNKKISGPKENPAPTDGMVIFNNLVKGANLVLHNGTLAFGKENSYDGFIVPTKYFSDGAKLTLKGGTLDISNGRIESGDTFSPDSITVIGDANLKLDLNFTTGKIDFINSSIVSDSVGAGSLTITGLNFLDNIDSTDKMGTTKILPFVKANELADGKTLLSSAYNNVITKNAGYTIKLGTTNKGKDSVVITKVISAGGLPVALSLGQNSELSDARGNQYTLSSDEVITGVNGNNSWTKGYVSYLDGVQKEEKTSNQMKGSTFTINGEGHAIRTNDNVVGIEVGVENAVQQNLFINDVKTSNNKGFSGFDTAIINNGGIVTIKNSVFNDNVSSSKGGAIYNGQGGVLNLVAENSKDILFTNNIANGVANDIYNEGIINVSGNGNVTFESGISGVESAIINNTGNIILSSDNSSYKGSFIQTEGSTTVGVGSKFFGGSSNIQGGTLNWYTNEELGNDTSLTISGADFVLGNGTDSARFVVENNIDIDNANSITINSNANLVYKKESTIKTIVGEGKLSVDGTKLTFNSSSSIGNVSFESKNNSSVEFSSMTNNSDILSTILSGDNTGLKLIYNNTNLNTDLNLDGTKLSSVDFKGDVITNSAITGTGVVTNSGNLTIKSDMSGMMGSFTQASGTTVVGVDGKIFGGDKNINGGTLTITSADEIDYSNVNLGDNASFTHITLSENENIIDNNLLKFNGSGSTAKFTSSNGVQGLYNLKNNITSSVGSNTIIIENSKVSLKGDNDFTGNTKYELKNSELNLIEKHPNEKTVDYVFDNLVVDNSSLSFNVAFKENSDKLSTDTITINNASQVFKFGRVYISGEDYCTIGSYETEKNVLSGATFDVNPADVLTEVISTKWKYIVRSNSDKTSVIVEVVGSAGNDPLYEANAQSGNRNFQLEDETYHLKQNLSETKGQVSGVEGSANFGILGNDKETCIISGKIVDSLGDETGVKGSLFNIAQDTKVDLTISNVTIQDTEKSGNGSVVENNSADSKITISDAIIKNASSTGDGGAIYNGVQPTNSDEQNLIISDTKFSNNSSSGKGGAIYNSGNMVLSNTTFDKGNENAKNDIYLADSGSLTLVGTNTINSEISGEVGSSIKNEGGLDITADNSNYKGSFTQAGDSITLVKNKFFSGDINIESGKLAIQGGEVTLKNNDSWSREGTIFLESGSLTIDGLQSNEGSLKADGGNLYIKTGKLVLGENSYITKNTQLGINSGASLDIEGGKIEITSVSNWEGTINLGSNNKGGELYYGANSTGTLNAESGKLYLLDNSVLNIKTPSQIKSEVDLTISNKATVNVNDGANLELDKNDVWNGKINVNSNGSLKTDNVNNINYGGVLNITNGANVEFANKSNIYITNNSSINGGNISLVDNSSLNIASGVSMSAEKLTMKDNSLFNAMNNSVSTIKIDDLTIEGANAFAIDLNLKNKTGDKFVINNLNNTGSINISNINFIGKMPVTKNIDFKVFEVNGDDKVDFAVKTQKLFTPIGSYKLKAMDNGVLRLSLTDFNQQVFRGQASTLAAYNNQLLVDDLLTNHFIQHGEQYIEDAKNINKTADVSPILAPYQNIPEEGSAWMRTYVAFEKLSMTHGLHVGNNTYGSLFGVDMRAIQLKHGWKMIPTVYLGYTGGNQYFKKVDMYQNGVQAGFMSTFIKNQFISSIMAYGGGYINDMSVSGHTDNTGTWFAGVAGKFAYNLNATKNFILQPNVFVSYNAFGKQNWHTGFGEMSMNSGMLNGINVAPGLNFIYRKQTWSVYATVQYMYNINDKISGSINGMDLPSIAMKHGYLQYGFGFTKSYKDKLHSYLQIAFRNGGRTGVGFQVGLRYMFGKNFKG